MSNARKLVPVNSPTLVLKRSEVYPQASANDVVKTPTLVEPAGIESAPGVGTRLGAFAALCGVAAALAYGGYTVYSCVRDSFAVPTILGELKKEFGGIPTNPPVPLNAWEQYAQVLLESNEFLFVD